MEKDKVYRVGAMNPEWDIMWEKLANHPINARVRGDKYAATSRRSGETWEYMGTELVDDHLMHCFRHRDHPVTGEREYVWVDVSKGFEPENLKNA